MSWAGNRPLGVLLRVRDICLGFWGYVGKMENKMEAIILGFTGYSRYSGIMENKMEATIMGFYRV